MYNQDQITFILSMLANTGSVIGSANDIEKQLLSSISNSLKALKSFIGDWSVAWGPTVYQAPGSKVADSMMYVAKQEATAESPAKLVLAVAGTNGISAFGWIVLDLWVSQQAPWNLLNPKQGKLSMGSYTGFQILRTFKPGPNAVKSGYTIKEFLTEEAANPLAVSVAGHSLGGALSPPLALWLHEKKSSWDPRGTASLDVLPTAGPTSGDGTWAAYYDRCLGDKTKRIWNSKDIVPHAWSLLDGLENIYAPEIEPDDWVKKLVAGAQYLSANGDYTQINTDEEFQGSVASKIIVKQLPSFVNFLTQALFQHTFGYLPLLGIGDTPELRAALEKFKQQPDEMKAAIEHEEPAMALAAKRKG